jgi:plastocyanin
VGLNVDPATRLFTVVDLSTVWVLADVHERDIGRVRVGSDAQIASDAFSERQRDGRVSYIDPQLDAATRTTKARIELQNPSGELRLGMYVDVVIATTAAGATTTVPRSALQNVGNRTVVYLADANAPGTFVEREVRLGRTAGDDVEVVAGVQPGDLVVTTGSFSIRAERERVGLRTTKAVSSELKMQTAKISVTEEGYEPATITVKAGHPTKLTFVRTSDKVCGTEVVFPSLKLKRALPLNQPVDVDFTPSKSGEITFVCDMNMLKGTIVVQ